MTIDDKDCLVKALEEMGYTPVVSEEAKNLYGYQNDKREQKAHVIIPRKQVGGASNDVGFENVEGKWKMHLSEYDQNAKTFDPNKLKQFYSKHRVLKHVKKTSKYSFSSQSVEKDGSIRIKLKRMY